jgi:hypothetical protein
LRLSGDGGEADGVRCSRGLGNTPPPPNVDAGWLDPYGVHEATENRVNDAADFEMKPTHPVSALDLELVANGELKGSAA